MKVALVTGAASGIGHALCQVYLEQGASVIMVDKDEDNLQKKAQLFSTQFIRTVAAMPCDVRDEQAVQRLADQVRHEFGRIDWLYNNAGIIGELGPVWGLPMHSVRQVMEVNLFGMLHVIQAFTPLLFAQPFNSHLINMASLYALCSGSQMSSYAMSKHAVLALSESLYFDLKRLNKPVDLSVVFPSFTDTSLLSNNASKQPDSFYESLQSLLTRSKSAMDVASHIVSEVERKRFYILPDREVKTYAEERTNALIKQEYPHQNNLEKLMNSLAKRAQKET